MRETITGKICEVTFVLGADGEPAKNEVTLGIEYRDGSKHFIVVAIDRMTNRIKPGAPRKRPRKAKAHV